MGLGSLTLGAGTASADHYGGRFSTKSACEDRGSSLVNQQSAAYTKYRCTFKGGWMLYLYD